MVRNYFSTWNFRNAREYLFRGRDLSCGKTCLQRQLMRNFLLELTFHNKRQLSWPSFTFKIWSWVFFTCFLSWKYLRKQMQQFVKYYSRSVCSSWFSWDTYKGIVRIQRGRRNYSESCHCPASLTWIRFDLYVLILLLSIAISGPCEVPNWKRFAFFFWSHIYFNLVLWAFLQSLDQFIPIFLGFSVFPNSQSHTFCLSISLSWISVWVTASSFGCPLVASGHLIRSFFTYLRFS